MKDGLTKKQIAVLKGIGDGLHTKEIATKMKRSTKTVEDYRMQLQQLFKVSGQVNLARIAIAFGISSLCLMCCSLAAAQPFLVVSNQSPVVKLGWAPPGTGTVASYNVYYGVGSRQYTNVSNVGNSTTATITLPARGVTFFFAVTDVTSGGLQSPFSNEVSYTPPLPLDPPTQQPLTIITVMKSSQPDGVFADAGMRWSDTPTNPAAYYKLRIDKGIVASTATPPIPR